MENNYQQIQSLNKELLRVQDMMLYSLTPQSISASKPASASSKPSIDSIKQTGLKPQIPQRKRIQPTSLSKATGSEASAVFAQTSDQVQKRRDESFGLEYCSESDQSFSPGALAENPESPSQAQLNRIDSQNNRIEHQNHQIQSQNKELLKVQDILHSISP